MATRDELKSRARQIKNEVEEGRNTANRVGGLLEDFAESMATKTELDEFNSKVKKVEENVSSTLSAFSTVQQKKMDDFQTSIDEQIAEQDANIKQQLEEQNENVDNKLKETDEQLATLGSNISEKNIFLLFFDNEYVGPDGEIIQYPNWKRTQYINVDEYSSIKVECTYDLTYCAFYDENKVFIQRFFAYTPNSTIEIPKGAKFAMLSGQSQYIVDTKIHANYLYKEIIDQPIIPMLKTKYNAYIGHDLVKHDAAKYIITEPIYIENDSIINCKGLIVNDHCCCAETDENATTFTKSLMNYFVKGNVSDPFTIFVEGGKFICFSGSVASRPIVQISTVNLLKKAVGLFDINVGIKRYNCYIDKNTLEFVEYLSSAHYCITNPVHLRKDDAIIVKGLSGVSVALVVETDETGNNIISKLLDGNENRLYDFTYKAERDIYLSFCYTHYDSTISFTIVKRESGIADLMVSDDHIKEIAETVSPVAGTGILDFNKKEIVLPILQNINKSLINQDGTLNSIKPLVISLLGDIHGDINNCSRYLEFCNEYKNYISDRLQIGDIAPSNYNDYISFSGLNGWEKTLTCIGNHDNFQAPNDVAVYNRYFENISQWGVSQPSNAASNGLCYYYKDYPSNKIRLIVLNSEIKTGNDADQMTWFNEALNGAKSLGYSVIAAQHIPVANTLDFIESPFTSPQINSYGGDGNFPNSIKAVDDFIKSGGKFICWLHGHTHSDYIGTIPMNYNNYNLTAKQIVVVIGAGMSNELWQDTIRVVGEKSQDLFDIISFDTISNQIKIARIGAEWSQYLQHKTTIAIDYANCKILNYN